MKRFITMVIACMLCWFASAQSAFRLHYWFDTQHDRGVTAVSENGSWQTLLETDGLAAGFHTLYTQVQDSSGRWFLPKSFYFYKTTTQEAADLSEYIVWFDQEVNPTHRGVLANGTLLLDTDSLPTGFHTINIQFGHDSKSTLKSYMFYKQPAQQTVPELSEYIVWFDEDSTHTYRGSLSNGTMLIDVDSLRSGFHTINIQFGSGSSATLKSFLFYKSTTQPAANETMRYTMWIDQDIENKRTGTFRNEHLILDLGTISTGFHTLHMQFGEGSEATLKSFYFYRKPHAELQIVRYVYWINDLDLQRQVVELVPQDTVDLITLLQLEQQPIRSNCFHFNPNDGTPVVNAKNEIHFTFYNAQERSVTRTFPYIDYNIVDTIYADTIERNTTRIVEAPSANHIHWFKLSAGEGDSISFRASKKCTMQLFAPSGALVFTLTGNSSVQWYGAHAWESGTYYLAVHDVEDTGTMDVSYQWLYRYAVIAWDVHLVGNGGISSITFQGNGYNVLDTVFLYRGTDTLQTLYIGRESRVTTSVVFNFEGVDTGMYQAVFKFVDEDLYKSEVVYVETAKPIVLTTTCSYPQSFLRGSTVTYTYTITNTGNMTAYNVPMRIFIRTNDFSSISHLELQGIRLKKLYEFIGNFDSLTYETQQLWKDFSNQVGELHYFEPYINANENGDSCSIYCGYFFYNFSPSETKTVKIIISSRDNVDVWLAEPDEWNIIKYSANSSDTDSNHNLNYSKVHFCCLHDYFEEYITEKAQAMSLASALTFWVPIGGSVVSGVGIGLQVIALASQIAAKVACTGRYGNEKLLDSDGLQMSIGGIALSFAAGIKGISWVESIAYNLFSYLTGFPSRATNKANRQTVERSPECFTIPMVGGTSMAYAPVDPNEIIGYVAESGSLAVGTEQIHMPFTIEYENDTLFATTHAHTVVVTDTIDGNVYDLESFSATSFTIGENVTPAYGEQSFVQTVDMRPEIYALAQVQLNYRIDSTFAVATWTFSSLDPMTLEPTEIDTLGFLGIGGTGEVDFTINRKDDLPDSTIMSNRAYITFDNEEPIATSTWRNVIDNTPPTSRVDSVAYDGGTATVSMHATDNLSGVWRYNVYGQIGESWLQLATNIAADTAAVVEAVPEQYDSFRTTAIDSAGNVEPLRAAPPTIYDTLNITSCDQYTWYASTYTESGEYIRRALSPIPGENDTVTTLNLTINSSTSGDTTASACNSFTWYDTVLTASTSSQTHTGINTAGCDSVVTLYLTVNHDEATTETVTDCDSIEWNGQIYATSGVYTFDTVSAAGCDSVVTLNLTLNHSTVDTQTVTAADSYEWNGREIATSGVYRDTLQTAAGCDSVIVLNLTLLQGIEQAELEQVNVYPNPTRGKVYISVDGVRKVEVYDVNGRHIRTFRETQTVDLSRYPVGIYTLRIETDKGKYACRVTRQ